MAKTAKSKKPKKTRKRQASAKAVTTKARAKEPATVVDYVRFAADRLKRAKVVFAHGTTDPIAEAAFIVAETLAIHHDEIADSARRRVSAANGVKIRALLEQR